MEGEDLSNLSPDAQALLDVHGQGTPKSVIPESEMTAEQRIIKQFDEEMDKWGGLIYSMSSRMTDIAKCVDVQMDLFDNRHRVIDRKHKLLRQLSKFQKKYTEKYAERLAYYTTGYDRKITATERAQMTNADTAQLKYNIDLLENHINQIDHTFKLIENMIFGLGHRIKLEEYLRKQ